MKILLYLIILFIFTSCSTDKDAFWCGDHPCINKKEKEAYFKKTMIIEIKDLKKKASKNDSEIEKIIQQARKGEKRRIKEEKELAKQVRLDKKRRIKEEKELAKQVRLEEKKIIKEEKKSYKKKVLKTENVPLEKEIVINAGIARINISSTEFSELVKKITKKNMFRSYPNINDIPK